MRVNNTAYNQFQALKKLYPNPKVALNYKTPIQLLIAIVLSAQSTDKGVNKITPALFMRYKSAEDFANADISELETMIYSTGYYRNKARNIKEMCFIIVNDFNSDVPDNMLDLVNLPGVGRKTASVILGEIYGIPAITVDTHVLRLSKRIGWTKSKDPIKVEKDIANIFDKKDWFTVCNTLIYHGRNICDAKNPKCIQCPISSTCRKILK